MGYTKGRRAALTTALMTAAAVAVSSLTSLSSLTAPMGPGTAVAAGPGGDHESRPQHVHRSPWVQTWSTSHTPPAEEGLSAEGFHDQTVRMIVHTSAGGSGIRIRLSNEYGEAPLDVGAVSVGLQAPRGEGASIEEGTGNPLTFGGDESFVIPAGAEAYSDPIRMRVPESRNLVVSVYLPGDTGPASWHPAADQTNFLAEGNHTADVSGGAYTAETRSWFYLEGVAVRAPRVRGTVVAFGDSITDGAASTVDANHRWPNYLARRLDDHGWRDMGVVNAGIGGNRILSNAGVCCGGGGSFGESALTRFGDDAVGNAGVRTVIFTEGINDIGTNSGFHPDEPVTTEQLIDGMRGIIAQAHAKGLRIIGGTLLPYKGAAYYTERGERIRQEVNHWIRTSGAFDGVVDFDQATRDPVRPRRLKPAYDSGDHLHPSDAGYRAMAEAVDLRMLMQVSARMKTGSGLDGYSTGLNSLGQA